MDAKLFRLPTKPNFYASIASASPFDGQQRNKQSTVPTPDSRFPGWAAPMADARLVTDYQPHCARNVPAGKQYATKEWMTKNAMEIIRVGRARFAEQTGAIYGTDPSVVPPAALVVSCTAADCSRQYTSAPGGIGMERADAAAPDLFGTWEATATAAAAPAARVPLTSLYEGGRNTPRGQMA